MRKENLKESKKNSGFCWKKLLIVFLALIIIGILAYFGKYFYDKYNSDKSSNALNEIKIDTSKLRDGVTERMLQVTELKKQNTDIIGWLEIENTSINYPVLKCDNNDYYMKHDYKKEKNKNGSLFVDMNYNIELPSTNMLIYGHNNQNGTMFEELLKYKKQEFYNEHPTIRYTTDKGDYQYEIISAFLSRVYYTNEKDVFRYYYFINAETEQEFNDFVNNGKKASLYDTGKKATYGDELMTLSTCSYHTEDGRFAVVARKLK